MNLTDTLRSIIRRWYLFLLGLLLTAGMSWSMYNYIQPTYEAAGSILLMPAEEIVGDDGNPFLYLGGMSEVVDVLVRRSSSAESVDPLIKQFEGAEIVTTADRTTSSPMVLVEVSALSSDTALDSLKAALTTVTRNLDSMQNEVSVAPSMRISTKELVVDDVATVNNKMQMQIAIVVAAAGVAATLMLTGFIDGVLQARKLRHSRKPDAGEEPQEPTSVRAPINDSREGSLVSVLPDGSPSDSLRPRRHSTP